MINGIKILLEYILLEGLVDIKTRFFPDMDNNIFNQLIKLDPTYKGGDIAGNYSRWVLNLYNNNKLKEEDFYKVGEYLSSFEKNKRLFKNKDIFQFKDLPSFSQALENIAGEEEDLSSRQQQRELKRQGTKDIELLHENDNWSVYTPLTYEASCVLGAGTQWCTATGKTRSYYDRYTEEGKLYVIISKSNPKEKYQFHFESATFTDEDDGDILLTEFFSSNRELLKYFGDIINKLDDDSLVEIFEDIRNMVEDRYDFYNIFNLENITLYSIDTTSFEFNDKIFNLKNKLKNEVKDTKFIDYIIPTEDYKVYDYPFEEKDLEFQIPINVNFLHKNDYLISELCMLPVDFIEKLPEIANTIIKNLEKVQEIFRGNKNIVILDYLKNKNETSQLSIFPEVSKFLKDNFNEKTDNIITEGIKDLKSLIPELEIAARKIKYYDIKELERIYVNDTIIDSWEEYI